MKKSKVIIPAMAMILFSTAASISGTVAWFTASRVFNTDVGNFAIAQLDGNLEAKMGAGVGTTYTEATNSVSVPTSNYLIDASFDHTGGKSGNAYRLSRDVANTYDSFDTYGSKQADDTTPKWLYRTTGTGSAEKKYYVAVQWTIEFKYTFNQDSSTIGVFLNLDFAKTHIDASTAGTSTGTMDSAKGFRIAFVGGGHNVVWGGLASTTDDQSTETKTEKTSQVDGHYTYIKNGSPAANRADYNADVDTTTSGSTTTYGDFISSAKNKSGVSYTMKQDGGSENPNALERVATITKGKVDNGSTATSDENVGETTVVCVAWYEGTDPNVYNGTVMKTCKAYMSFYSRLDPVPAP